MRRWTNRGSRWSRASGPVAVGSLNMRVLDLRRWLSVRSASRCTLSPSPNEDHRGPEPVDRGGSRAGTVGDVGAVREGHDQVPADVTITGLGERQGESNWDVFLNATEWEHSDRLPADASRSNATEVPSGTGTISSAVIEALAGRTWSSAPRPVHPVAMRHRITNADLIDDALRESGGSGQSKDARL